MDSMTEKKQEEMRASVALMKNAIAKRELAEAAMSGFFAGIQSREALETDKTA